MQHGPHGDFDYPHDSTWCNSSLHTPRTITPPLDTGEQTFPAIHRTALNFLGGVNADDHT